MCQFVSWVEKGDHIYFLTHDLIYNTPRGKVVQERCSQDDLVGHGAIRLYFDLAQDEGKNYECTEFATTKGFPKIIVSAIKKGEMRGLAVPEKLLTQLAWAEYQKIRQPAWAEYQKIEQLAWAEYQKIEQLAWAEYQKIRQSAWAEYQKIRQSVFWDLFSFSENRNPNWR